MLRLRVQDVMQPTVQTVAETDAAMEAYDRMRMKRIRHLVVMREGHPVGVISDRDLGGPRGEAIRRDHTVADLMTPHVTTAPPKTTLRQAANLMRGRTIGCLPVVDDGKLVGIVTTSDFLELLGRGVEHVEERNRRFTLRRRAPRVASAIDRSGAH